MLDKIKKHAQVRQVSGEVPIYHRYTLGIAGERFFKALRDEKRILTSPCPKCLDRLLPPKIYCERCFTETSDDWAAVDGPGYLRSFTVLHRSLDDEPLEAPVFVGLIGWRGARGGLVHRLEVPAGAEVSLGMAVEPVWADQRTGGMSDISHFRPVER